MKTLRVSFLDTPSLDTPVVTGLGSEGARQKILCHGARDKHPERVMVIRPTYHIMDLGP
jgi:hypothetical protein